MLPWPWALLWLLMAVHPYGSAGERLCRNPSCSEAISIVRAYRDFSNDDGSFSFRRLATFSVLSKDDDTWEGNIAGRRGFFPRSMVEELSIFEPNPKFAVPRPVRVQATEDDIARQMSLEALRKEALLDRARQQEMLRQQGSSHEEPTLSTESPQSTNTEPATSVQPAAAVTEPAAAASVAEPAAAASVTEPAAAASAEAPAAERIRLKREELLRRMKELEAMEAALQDESVEMDVSKATPTPPDSDAPHPMASLDTSLPPAPPAEAQAAGTISSAVLEQQAQPSLLSSTGTPAQEVYSSAPLVAVPSDPNAAHERITEPTLEAHLQTELHPELHPPTDDSPLEHEMGSSSGTSLAAEPQPNPEPNPEPNAEAAIRVAEETPTHLPIAAETQATQLLPAPAEPVLHMPTPEQALTTAHHQGQPGSPPPFTTEAHELHTVAHPDGDDALFAPKELTVAEAADPGALQPTPSAGADGSPARGPSQEASTSDTNAQPSGQPPPELPRQGQEENERHREQLAASLSHAQHLREMGIERLSALRTARWPAQQPPPAAALNNDQPLAPQHDDPTLQRSGDDAPSVHVQMDAPTVPEGALADAAVQTERRGEAAGEAPVLGDEASPETGGLPTTGVATPEPTAQTDSAAEDHPSATADHVEDVYFHEDALPSSPSHEAAAHLNPEASLEPPPLHADTDAGGTVGDPELEGRPDGPLPQEESIDIEATLEAERMVLVEGLQDKYRVDCVKWASRGGCSRNANWMKSNCALSCKNREWTEQLETRRQSLEEALRPQPSLALPLHTPSEATPISVAEEEQAAFADASVQATAQLQAETATAVALDAPHGQGIPESSDVGSPNDAVDLEMQHEEQELRIEREEQHQSKLVMDAIEPEALPHVQRILAERQRAATLQAEAGQGHHTPLVGSSKPASPKVPDAATTKRVAELENQAAMAREAQTQAETALQEASTKLQEQRDKISDLEAVKRRLTESQKRQQEALRSRPPSGASSEQLAGLQAECERLRAQAEVDQAQLATVAAERDGYLTNWQAAYAECVRLSEQVQGLQAVAPVDTEEGTAARSEAHGKDSAAAARLATEVQRLHEVVQAREVELSQLRSMLATVAPDKEDDARELERERAHVQALTARCEQLNAQLQDKELRLQQLLLQQEHLAIDRDSLAAQMEKLTSLRTDTSMPAAQAALHLALAASEKKLQVLQERHGEMLRFHEKLRQTAEQKLETVKELYEERMHKMEAQLSEKAARIRAMEIDMARVHSPVLGAGDGSQQREADELRRWLYEAQQQAEKANKSLTMARQKITTQEAELQNLRAQLALLGAPAPAHPNMQPNRSLVHATVKARGRTGSNASSVGSGIGYRSRSGTATRPEAAPAKPLPPPP